MASSLREGVVTARSSVHTREHLRYGCASVRALVARARRPRVARAAAERVGPDRDLADRGCPARRVRALRRPARTPAPRRRDGGGDRRRARGIPYRHGARAERRAAPRGGQDDSRLVPALYRIAKRMTFRRCVGRSLFWLASTERATAR